MATVTKTIHVSLPESLKNYMDARVREEHFSTLSDYVRDLVREDQKRRAEERLESLLLEGLTSGRGVEVGTKEWDAFWEKTRARIEQARKKKAAV